MRGRLVSMASFFVTMSLAGVFATDATAAECRKYCRNTVMGVDQAPAPKICTSDANCDTANGFTCFDPLCCNQVELNLGGACQCGDDVVDGSVTLNADVACNSPIGPALEVVAPSAALNVNGKRILCNSGSCGTGVRLSGGASDVFGPGLIQGFQTGVDGSNLSGTSAEKLVVDGLAANPMTNGILGVANVNQNLVMGATAYGANGINISSTNAQSVRDNVVTNNFRGILVGFGAGNIGMDVIHNRAFNNDYAGLSIYYGNIDAIASVHNILLNNGGGYANGHDFDDTSSTSRLNVLTNTCETWVGPGAPKCGNLTVPNWPDFNP